jgi:hypothetical protein
LVIVIQDKISLLRAFLVLPAQAEVSGETHFNSLFKWAMASQFPWLASLARYDMFCPFPSAIP